MDQIKQYGKVFFLLAVFWGFSLSISAKTQVEKLVCEYHTNPIGIDVKVPRLSWQIVTDQENLMQTAYEIRVAETPSDLNKKSKLIWSAGKVNSDQSVNVLYEGPELESMQRVYWQVRVWDNNNKATKWSEPAFWEMGILSPELWSASWITMKNEPQKEGSKPAHYYRSEFSSGKKVSSARIYATSLGIYELFINGEKVGDELFTPGWTSYNKRLQYQTYDVTDMIQQKNAIGAVVGDGWYRGNIGFSTQHNYYGEQIALLVQLKINYTDGTSETINTDKNWKVSDGPIRESDIYNGETYDANLEMNGWTSSGFNDGSWQNVTILDHSKDILIAPQGEPVKAIEELKPIKSLTTPKGEMVFDMGQNMVGWVRLKIKGKKGDAITLKFAEVLDKEGNFYTANLRSAKATDTYILKGDGEEIYEPKFTFHGFRFVQIEGVDKMPEMDQITGVVIYSDMAPTGTFSCSDPLINQLQHNIQWGQKGNFLDVPTDCPQRNERLGWTGDAQVFSPTAAFNFDVAPFYTKWLGDLAADQVENGVVPHVIPDVLNGGGGSTAWADAAIIVPWTTYLAYGDTRVLKVQYPSMKAWVEYMRTRAGEDYLWTGDTHYGDWLAFATTRSDYPGATTEKDLIATAYYSYSSGLLAEIAAIIGKNDEAKKYQKLSENIKKAFVQEFVTPAGRLVSHTQTAYCLALSFDLLREDLVPKAAKFLADDVKKMGHLTTGFVGTPLLCKTLSDNGYADLAFMLLNRKDYPSWLYPVTQGATTIWERWDGQKPDGTFQDVGMNSFNHYAYGAIGEWLYTYVSGLNIDTQSPGYKHFTLAPHPGGGLTNAQVQYKSLYGNIESGWEVEGNTLVYKVVIPANTSATVVLPGASLDNVTLNTQPLKATDKKAEQVEKGVSLTLGSGTYQFSYAL
ncbi:glycoside hydrolase family 78 protein [Maribellus maritimus]|uniref:glycoside hydrolase family 78 protein n=1 Tax=Maribellus maritimus TaxID=2870838 RepID=UPI001EEC287E|nr:glycoside hydrolase family 78 protein [Maribellus maritimus]MCG6190553.1 glycoside hydrolase family 78 protein [Maribellus maritimus]